MSEEKKHLSVTSGCWPINKAKPDTRKLKDLTESQLKLAKQVLDWTIKGKGDNRKPTSPVEVPTGLVEQVIPQAMPVPVKPAIESDYAI